MDDDNSDWFSAADEAEPTKKEAGEVPGADAEAQQVPEAETEEYIPNKLLLFKHWIRPRYLQYKYIYDYRRSYYDDVIEAIESRRKGYRRDIPRPQTWAERILRTYRSPLHRLQTFDRYLEDIKLVTRSEVSGRIYNYQASSASSSFNRKVLTKISSF